MEAAVIASILVSLIAAVSGYASQRAAAKASNQNASTSSRTEMEKEAYERARSFDTATIARQDAELIELRKNVKDLNADVKRMSLENEILHEDNHRLRDEVAVLRQRFGRIERHYPTDEMPTYIGTETDPLMREVLDG